MGEDAHCAASAGTFIYMRVSAIELLLNLPRTHVSAEG